MTAVHATIIVLAVCALAAVWVAAASAVGRALRRRGGGR